MTRIVRNFYERNPLLTRKLKISQPSQGYCALSNLSDRSLWTGLSRQGSLQCHCLKENPRFRGRIYAGWDRHPCRSDGLEAFPWSLDITSLTGWKPVLPRVLKRMS